MVVTPQMFRDAMRRWPTGVAIVTTRDPNGKAEGMTVNSLISISLEPPLILVSLADSSRTLEAVNTAGRFAVSLLCSGSNQLCWSFARDQEDRDFSGFEDLDGLPVVPSAEAAMTCEVEQTITVADHVLVIGRVTAEKIKPSPSNPLVFFNGALRALSEDETPVDLFEGW